MHSKSRRVFGDFHKSTMIVKKSTVFVIVYLHLQVDRVSKDFVDGNCPLEKRMESLRNVQSLIQSAELPTESLVLHKTFKSVIVYLHLKVLYRIHVKLLWSKMLFRYSLQFLISFKHLSNRVKNQPAVLQMNYIQVYFVTYRIHKPSMSTSVTV